MEIISLGMEGTHMTSRNRKGVVEGEGSDVEPTCVILKPFPSPTIISSGPSLEVESRMFLESEVTWF